MVSGFLCASCASLCVGGVLDDGVSYWFCAAGVCYECVQGCGDLCSGACALVAAGVCDARSQVLGSADEAFVGDDGVLGMGHGDSEALSELVGGSDGGSDSTWIESVFMPDMEPCEVCVAGGCCVRLVSNGVDSSGLPVTSLAALFAERSTASMSPKSMYDARGRVCGGRVLSLCDRLGAEVDSVLDPHCYDDVACVLLMHAVEKERLCDVQDRYIRLATLGESVVKALVAVEGLMASGQGRDAHVDEFELEEIVSDAAEGRSYVVGVRGLLRQGELVSSREAADAVFSLCGILALWAGVRFVARYMSRLRVLEVQCA